MKRKKDLHRMIISFGCNVSVEMTKAHPPLLQRNPHPSGNILVKLRESIPYKPTGFPWASLPLAFQLDFLVLFCTSLRQNNKLYFY